MTEWNGRITEISKLEEHLDQFPNVKVLSLNIETVAATGANLVNAVTLVDLPEIIRMKCPLLEELKIVYRRNTSLWEFAEHLDAIFRFDRLAVYEFVWRGESPGIMGFMGNFDTAMEQRGRALRSVLGWTAKLGDRIEVSLEGVNCVCRNPHEVCPNPLACMSLKVFLELCRNNQIPLTRI